MVEKNLLKMVLIPPVQFLSLEIFTFYNFLNGKWQAGGRFNTHTPVAQKVADEVVFRRFQSEEVEFFLNRTSLTPPSSDFCCASFGKYQFKPFQLSFFSGFLYQDLFWVSWFYSFFERMRLKRKKMMFSHSL